MEEGISEDEANPDDIEDAEANLIVDEVEPPLEDSVSITQVQKTRRKNTATKKRELLAHQVDPEGNSCDEEEELRVAAINNALGNKSVICLTIRSAISKFFCHKKILMISFICFLENSLAPPCTLSSSGSAIGISSSSIRITQRKPRKPKAKTSESKYFPLILVINHGIFMN